jgi:NitT/TauT family transport system ATP-binding protein
MKPMSDLILAVNNLTKQYGEHVVIDHLSLTIRRGEKLALFAPSGAGKTTLIKILIGIAPPTSGSFQLFDPIPVTIFQEPRLFPFMTVEENIFLPFKAQARSITSADRQNYRRWLEVCELGSYKQHYPHQLSGGMKQKTALIRGLLSRPTFALLDEPFQSIGGNSKQAIIEHIKDSNPNLSLLLITHNPDEVLQLVQSVLFFEQSNLSHGKQIMLQSNASAAPLTFPEQPYFFQPFEIDHSPMAFTRHLNNTKEIL